MGRSEGYKIAIVASRFNHEITSAMVEAARARLCELGIHEIDLFWVPGAFEIPKMVQRLERSERYDGILPLGCVIQGETAHFEHICRTVSDALMRLTLEGETPIVFGVLTTYTEEQARARIAKAAEAAESLVELMRSVESLHTTVSPTRRTSRSRTGRTSTTSSGS
ncbi:MAG: 6,7-dimethyl-8-ribityllumazine synthase [Candidatus Bipolaricaulota bacterium]|nr:6,7-dimethyl-8-ribityllumazine synthase [Candidatus Bipolaricaulota bacterium]MCS7274299.1 6,7-dimethyl-8-ribityllumazine synthase [Candidatus Bipolaricaulota bacterium]MDW8111450.1 6,7-dimethyl-8-ribityllumazine synthase [Candidatus Bipolaricaulota bacterium]MDW8329407.1 6,7-dimethyl-8-ribityllumazine synthase [Candidatus Bipolaricaulota bacterium]